MKHRWVQAGKRGLRRGLGLVLAVSMVMGGAVLSPVEKMKVVQAEESAAKTISSMSYYSAADGPVLSASGVGQASYGFVMPVFNGGAATWEDVVSDLAVNVKVNGQWVNIDEVSSFVYNSNWGNWSDSGFHGYWFKLSETTYIQLASKANANVTLDYTMEFTNLSTTTITSMAPTQGPNLTAGVTGGAGFTYPTFNGDASIKYEQVAADLKAFIWSDETNEWIDIDNNAASGWIYDQNFGQFTDGGGGYWFTVDKTTKVRLASKSSPNVYIDYTITYSEPVRTNYTLSASAGTTYTAGDTGAIGMPLPYIDGSFPVSKELDNFVYEIKVDNNWVELADFSRSGFSYQGNGYNQLSDKNQWGYWVDGIYGLWFQPIQENMEFRIGYPQNGVKGGAIGNNYVNYTFIGNPNAPRPDVSDLGNINLGTPDDSDIADWNLIWNDEFENGYLDTNKWNYNTGYYIDNDPAKWGWGNNELEYYTDSEKNTFVQDGKVNLRAYYEPKTFPEIDPNRVAPYSSGKITTKDNFTFKYGRIDFRAKLPTGNGLWPALWMLPNDDSYGTWAASGEIDVMEARGRLPGSTCGTIHFGGAWPANTYIGGDYSFENGETFASDYHVYSVVWEEDNIKWYVDGKCFFKATNQQWYSLGDPNNINAPFDQEFYIIMNLACGGWFDGGLEPDPNAFPATMQVDYVRVYQAEGSTNGSFTDNSQGTNTVPVAGISLDKTNINFTTAGATEEISKTITPANATNKNVTWVSSNPDVATVSAGQVTAVANGTCVITATTKDGGFSASCTVNVNIQTTPETVPVTGVTISQTAASLNKGETVNLSAAVVPATATNKAVTWSTADSSVATVDQSGKVTAVTAGTTTITVRTADGNKTAACTVTVRGNEPITNTQGDEVRGLRRTDGTVEFYVNGAVFADLHYKVNGGGQINVGMNSDGNGNFTYTVNGLNIGDTIEYFFTYNPGQGALDSPAATFTLPAVSDSTGGGSTGGGSTEQPENPGNYTDVAAGKSASCSGSESDAYSAANLTDGNAGTRWASNFADDAWFVIDLGDKYSVNQVVLNWEAAYGKQYEILVSEDGANYTSVVRKTNGAGGIETIDFASVNARYIKFQGIERALPYGYSLWDVKVMGTTVAQPEVYEKISAGKAVVTSANENDGMAGGNVVDNNINTRWGSAFSDDQWIYIDLGSATKINRVVLNWEAAYGKRYQIQVSGDGVNWTTVKEENNSDGGIDEIEFAPVSARYVKMQGVERALPYGYSLFEMEVYGVVK